MFPKKKETLKDGSVVFYKRYQCKECTNKSNNDRYHELSPERKEQKRQTAYRYMIKQYGMTLEEYDQLYEKQNGCCAICFIKEQPNKKLSIDHDHKTGKIRGLLCNPCNVSMGYAKEDIKILEKMIQYLEDHNE